MAGYCTVDDVAAAFPGFQRSAAGSTSDAQIQSWIDARAGRIYSAFLGRGIDIDSLVLTARQTAFLQGVNADGAIGDLGDALQGNASYQPGESSASAQHRAAYERVLKEIAAGVHDRLFNPDAATMDTESGFGGVAGAETTDGETPEDRGENRAFGKDQTF